MGRGSILNTSTGNYDIAVAYRIYPKVAKPAEGLPYSENKYLLSEICLRSFRRSLGNLRAKVWVLLDACPDEYVELFQKYFAPEDLVLLRLPGIGNGNTFLQQIEILLKQNDADMVYFAEDDYIYRPDEFKLMIDFMQAHKDVDFISPYDHPEYYESELLRKPSWIRCFRDRHWRTGAMTCLTFLTTRSTLRKSRWMLHTYGLRNWDWSIWLSLTKMNVFRPVDFCRWLVRDRFLVKVLIKTWAFGAFQILFGTRYKLWSPIPAIATHLDAARLSAGTDWIELMKEEELSIRRNLASTSR